MKCPCENCLLLPRCNNRNSRKPLNFVISINKCSLLYQFLEITKIYIPTTEIWSDLEEKELTKRGITYKQEKGGMITFSEDVPLNVPLEVIAKNGGKEGSKW